MEILIYGNNVLRKNSDEVDINSVEEKKSILSSIEQMKESMYQKRGIGLAAPQVGILKKFFIIDIDQESETDEDGSITKVVPGRLQVFINPSIVSASKEMVVSEEGCLSIPGLYEKVRRHESIVLRYFDENFNEQEIAASELLSIVLQHENDHLYGKLFVDRLPTVRKTLIKNKLNKGKIL